MILSAVLRPVSSLPKNSGRSFQATRLSSAQPAPVILRPHREDRECRCRDARTFAQTAPQGYPPPWTGMPGHAWKFLYNTECSCQIEGCCTMRGCRIALVSFDVN